MADKVTTSSELKLVAKFNDNDTRTITIDSPKDSLTAADINAVGTTIKNNNVILGDKGASAFNSFIEAKKVSLTRTTLDLR